MTHHQHAHATRTHAGPGKRTTVSNAGVTSSDNDDNGKVAWYEGIRICAYRKWEAAGKPTGDGVQFWLEAEQSSCPTKRLPRLMVIAKMQTPTAKLGIYIRRSRHQNAKRLPSACKFKCFFIHCGFEPIYEYRIWGGRRLADLLTAPLPGDEPIGEAWLLSDRDDHPSRVAGGPLKGQTLGQLLKQSPEQLLGKLAGASAGSLCC